MTDKEDNKITIDGEEYDFTSFEHIRSICNNCVDFDNGCDGRVTGIMRPFTPGCEKFINKWKEENERTQTKTT